MQKSAIVSINYNGMRNEIKQTLTLSLKRLIAFMIDIVVVFIILLLIEGSASVFIAHFTQYNTSEKTNQFVKVFNSLHILIIPIMIGLSNSIVFKGQSLGSVFMRFKVLSQPVLWSSVLGCILRAFILMGPLYLYFILVFLPYVSQKISPDLQIPLLELTTLIWFVLVIPISIVAGRGQQGLHDWIVNVRVDIGHSQHSTKLFKHSQSSIITILIISIVAASLLSQLIHNSVLVKRIVSVVAPFADRFNDYRKELPISGMSQVYQDLGVTLNPDTYYDLYISMNILTTPITIEKYGIIIPPYTEIAGVYVKTCEAGLNKIKETTLNIGRKIQSANLKSKYFRISISRVVDLGIISYDLHSECLYEKEIEKPLQCSMGVGLGPKF
jgi:RDD family protein